MHVSDHVIVENGHFHTGIASGCILLTRAYSGPDLRSSLFRKDPPDFRPLQALLEIQNFIIIRLD